MKRTFGLITMAAFAVLAGCSRDNNKVDDPLKNDLSLAAQQTPGQLDSISAAERGYTNVPASSSTSRPAATTARRSTSSSTARRSTSTGTRTASSGTSAGTATGATQGGETVVKHTKRDAAIGAAAGAIIGATTSKDKVKGGVIGAAAGGILGAVIGNNVDKTKKKTP
jgi:hypothetical protein